MTDYMETTLGMRQHFEMLKQAFGKNVYNDFMLAHGIGYQPGPDTFALPRQDRHNCFGNALHMAIDNPGWTYVEGKVFVHGVPLDHAWCLDSDGNVVDVTSEGKGIIGYYGVPLKTEYVKRAVRMNGLYGVLDYFYAGKTAPKLFELGLKAGQQWLLDQPDTIIRRRRRKAVA